MHDALYANFNQDWTTDQLVALGRSVGLTSGSFRPAYAKRRSPSGSRSIDETATDRGVIGHTDVFVNGGKPLPAGTPRPTGLRLAIEDCARQERLTR